MMKNGFRLLVFAVMALLVASCSTTQKMKSTSLIAGLSEKEYLENVLANHSGSGWEALTAKMSLVLDVDNKPTKVSGTLRIKKGEVIQLSVAPFLGIEVARAEISPDGMLVIDRMNKRYVKVPFAELQVLAKADLDFHTLQALFLNELFLPGKTELSLRDMSAFDVELLDDKVQLDVRKTKRFSYRFITEPSNALLKESFIGLKNTPYGIEWSYGDFRLLEQKAFPTNMELSFVGGKKAVNATFSLSRLSTNSDWETHTKVSDKYERIPLENLLKRLLK